MPYGEAWFWVVWEVPLNRHAAIGVTLPQLEAASKGNMDVRRAGAGEALAATRLALRRGRWNGCAAAGVESPYDACLDAC